MSVTSTPPPLVVHGLTKEFNGHLVFKDVSFAIQPGQPAVILGKSGSGKSVLIDCILGFQKADGGEICLGDLHLSQAIAAGRHADFLSRFAVLFQREGLIRSLTVAENIALAVPDWGSDLEMRIRTLLGQVELDPDHVWDRHPSEMSGGMVKRVALARGLAANPSVFILDEPTSGLDPSTATSISGLLRDRIAGRDVVCLIVTHDHELAAMVGSDIYMVDDQEHSLDKVKVGGESAEARRQALACLQVGGNSPRQGGSGTGPVTKNWPDVLSPVLWIGEAVLCLRHVGTAFDHSSQIVKRINRFGVQSLPLVGLVAVVMGIVLAIQAKAGLASTGFKNTIPTVVAVSLTKFIAPVLTGLLLAGRVGSSFASELHSMHVNNEMRSLQLIGIPPARFVYAPASLVLLWALPLLTLVFIALSLGVAAGWVSLVETSLGMSARYFWQAATGALSLNALIMAISKSLCFAVCLVGVPFVAARSHWARRHDGGEVVTASVMWISIWVIVIDGIFNFVGR